MAYDTVYDVSQTWIAVWPALAMGALFTAVGAMLAFAPGLMNRTLPTAVQGRTRTIFSWVFFSFALIWTVSLAALSIPAQLALQAAARDGTCKMVEGVVEAFSPGDGNRKPETFTVSGVPFSYGDAQVTGGFNRTQGGGGPVRAGQRVRICYAPATDPTAPDGNIILRLEIASSK